MTYTWTDDAMKGGEACDVDKANDNLMYLKEKTDNAIVSVSSNKTLALADAYTLQKCTNSSDITITVPPNSSVAFETETEIEICQYGTGTVTLAGGSGVTINSKDSQLEIGGQYTSVALKKMATDEWLLIGSLTS